jgi:hypothetical protein
MQRETAAGLSAAQLIQKRIERLKAVCELQASGRHRF